MRYNYFSAKINLEYVSDVLSFVFVKVDNDPFNAY
jgi:hypothetical protein